MENLERRVHIHKKDVSEIKKILRKNGVGSKYEEVFKRELTPGMYRSKLRNFQLTLKRLAADEYKVARARTHDEIMAMHILPNIKSIRFLAQIKINTAGTITHIPEF